MNPVTGAEIGDQLTRFTIFPEDDTPEVGDITRSFSGRQWRTLKVARVKGKWRVTEELLHPDEWVDDPDWVMVAPREGWELGR